MQFPSKLVVAQALRRIQKTVDSEVDVRLQVYPDGEWAVRWGLSDYDQDHRGYWGASVMDPADDHEMLFRIAREMIDQAEDSASQNGEEV